MSDSTETPLVSVVIPVYNAASTICETVDSVLRQTYQHTEIVIVNDGSTDETAAVLAQYGDRITVIHQSNAGLASARNTGCGAARGEFIALLDADDRCVPERIAVQVAVMQNFDNLVLCSTEFSSFDASGPISPRYARQYYSTLTRASEGANSLYAGHQEITVAGTVFPVHIGNVYKHLVFGNFIHPPTLLFSSQTPKLVGPFDESLGGQTDWEWIIRASRTGLCAYIDSPMLEYRISPAQMSSPSRRGLRALELLGVITKIGQADPDLAQSYGAKRRTQLGRLWLEAADSVSETEKIKALNRLTKSVFSYAHINLHTLRVLLKILMPHFLMRLVRQARGRDTKGNLIRR